MKSKLDPRMEYYFFDDNFHLSNHQLMAGLLKPYKIKKVKLPYENPVLPKFWNEEGHFNIFVPLGNRKYDSLKSQNVSVYPYNSKE